MSCLNQTLFNVLECQTDPQGTVKRKVYKPNLPKAKAWALADKLNGEQDSFDPNVPFITYVVQPK